MIQFTIEAAISSVVECNTIISSNDMNTVDLAKKLGLRVPFIRPEELSTDTATTSSVITHTVQWHKKQYGSIPDNLILLQPTSPFRNSKDIKVAIKFFEKGKYDSLFSAFEDKMSIWKYKNKNYNPITYNLKKRKREQDSKSLIIENGAIYIFNIKKFLLHKVRLFGKIGCFLMNKKSSIEIDDNFDLHLAKNI